MGNPKRAARSVILNEKRTGRLTPQSCEECGATPTEAHHPDYDHPLVVEWLCPHHHHLRHPQPPNRHVTRLQAVRARLVPVAERLRAEGRTYQEIATVLGVTKGTVYKWINRPDYD